MQFHRFLLCAATVAIAAGSASSAMAQSASEPAGVCKAAKTVAVSAYGTWMGSGGAASIVAYNNVLTNIGGAWDTFNNNTFTAPCTGTYAFDIEYVRDTTRTDTDCGPTAGTFNDIYVTIWKQPVGGGSPARISNSSGAWAGETASSTYRTTAAYHLVAPLTAGDAVFTEVNSESGLFRCLAVANFSGSKIGR